MGTGLGDDANADDLLQSKTAQTETQPGQEAIQDGWRMAQYGQAKFISVRLAGFSKRTVDTAKKELGVISKKVENVWIWSLPEGVPEDVCMRKVAKCL